MSNPIKFRIKGLFLPLNLTFKQSSATRNKGESIWCEAYRGHKKGLGEGCPRVYVTRETVPQGLEWLAAKTVELSNTIFSLEDLKNWISKNEEEIDQHPAAFCAIETALLDLFAQENKQSVETLLGLNNPQPIHTYTAVLGDSSPESFKALLQYYLSLGFSNFKIKLNGQLAVDQQKLKTIHDYHRNSSHPFSIRLDANNLWKEKVAVAIPYLAQLLSPIVGIEEPIEPRNFSALKELNQALNIPVILDESLCNKTDFANLILYPKSFIANLKISKIGGVIRTLALIKRLKQQNIPIIIGAHVGETSVLTRAGMCAAKAAGSHLLAQEGGFGTKLLTKDQVLPSLSFGQAGKIQLSKIYQSKMLHSKLQIPIHHWNNGWGLRLSA